MSQHLKKTPTPQTQKIFSSALPLLALVFILGFVASELLHIKDKEADYFHIRRLHYYREGGHLIDPIIEAEDPEGHDKNLEKVKKNVQDFIDRQIQDQKATNIAFYVRSFSSTSWVGIHQDDKFLSASLGKLPLLITFYIKAQTDPSIFKKAVRYTNEIKSPREQITAPKERLQVGRSYTVEELLRNMIVYSDNISTLLLLMDKDIDLNLAYQIFSKLELPLPERGTLDYEITAKNYARFFRTLYRSTYLNKELSEKALKLLTQSDFDEGIVAGVPRNVVVAHKFGESGDANGEVQLHDCGIVYCGQHPYLLCVMTKGSSFANLKNIIKNISGMVYEHFSTFDTPPI